MNTDILIIGAGPAGLTAALRLLQLGYQVALIDRQTLPRPNLGESLTPGIRNILEYLDAGDLLDRVPRRAGLQTRVIWRGEKVALREAGSGTGLMVDRGCFDQQLLQLAESRGAHCMLPAAVKSVTGKAGAWLVQVAHKGQTLDINARFILDACGRQASGRNQHATAPPLLALWAECAVPTNAETRIEAMPEGWLWGSPLATGGYRLMAFCDPATPRHFAPGKPEGWLRATLAQSRMFHRLAEAPFHTAVQACAASPHVAENSGLAGRLKLGDAAFTLDPLSSSGVEKAMRFSLQAATAVHTVLHDSADEGLAMDFFQARLVETVARHMRWTQNYYAEAWPGREHAFWRVRGEAFELAAGNTPLLLALREALTADAPPADRQGLPAGGLTAMLRGQVTLSPQLSIVQMPCVVDDRVQLRLAVSLPSLGRPVAFVEGQEIVPLLYVLPYAQKLANLIDVWSNSMPRQTAVRIAGWLWRKGVVCAEGVPATVV
ncbi:flavin-dependent monooxygenase QhpG [Andreprevotia chitinilytica]|uniref:flavin-dependent monooxygenase QhpG n=1 Tax=Andreprevotia chitinilytica TaxID=396808 RepID=UPI000A8FB80C|nr:tryptophan 7-halogenase [Andreprevotia chitinilytica]